MNNVRSIQELNKRELEAGISTAASWHNDYRDTAFVYIGGLPFNLTEGDVVAIFSQYGEPNYINMVRDKETGKSKGFCFLRYQDQRSTDLAVDNLGGATLMGRVLRVDHTRYKPKDGEKIHDNTHGDAQEQDLGEDDARSDIDVEDERPLLPEERELQKLRLEHDDEDPMKAYLIEQKEEEVSKALQRYETSMKGSRSHGARRHEKHRHRDDGADEDKAHKRHREHGNGHRHRRRHRDSRSRSPRRDVDAKDREHRRRERPPSRSDDESRREHRRRRRRSASSTSRNGSRGN